MCPDGRDVRHPVWKPAGRGLVEPSGAPWRIVDAPPPSDPSRAPAAQPQPAHAPLLVAVGAIAVLVVAAVAIAAGVLQGSTSMDPAGVVVAVSLDADPSAEVVVEVAGAVVSPGVYRLPAGSRVGDALKAAGGYGPRVDAQRSTSELNLAAILEDGTRVMVPSRDDPPEADPPSGSGSSGSSSDGPAGGNATDGLLDLNIATQAELEALPGIGPVTATKIMDARAAVPFTSVEDLRTRKLLGQKAFDALKALVTVR